MENEERTEGRRVTPIQNNNYGSHYQVVMDGSHAQMNVGGPSPAAQQATPPEESWTDWTARHRLTDAQAQAAHGFFAHYDTTKEYRRFIEKLLSVSDCNSLYSFLAWECEKSTNSLDLEVLSSPGIMDRLSILLPGLNLPQARSVREGILRKVDEIRRKQKKRD